MVCGFVNQVSRYTCRYEQQDKLKGKTVRPVSLRVLPRRIIEEKRLLAASCRILIFFRTSRFVVRTMTQLPRVDA